ncbi:hypothetical protein P9273_07645 [Mesorhizobium sp. WSM4935]|uniref:hypothetical protein n=1 Tax=Mesorhizobium sp. WSM4935 TaxID=3038547 RepID=UPI0024155E16|nr:hypothetical protein [Mesorhizobium sp. WSM4935]MDG4874967.1 hypothetical protein [Mesorhizobium sp. WSM4935]
MTPKALQASTALIPSRIALATSFSPRTTSAPRAPRIFARVDLAAGGQGRIAPGKIVGELCDDMCGARLAGKAEIV